ncbi:hypothetical protein PUW21_12565 [Bacillus subtilis]|uniref:hypothetical protein n=1 Tax=Bacteria TaxID=2 RepID=UPI0023688D51|nr:hypothetical protein [Bacillus subtilis]WDI23840.1 hypothetical protein PUW21_12565 [Bacillus subtilis]
MSRIDDLNEFVKILYQIEQKYGFKIVSENPLESLAYMDCENEALYSYVQGHLMKWETE